MNEVGSQLLQMMFRPGEEVCVSYNKYGYHSVPLEKVLNGKQVLLVPTEDSCEKRNLTMEQGSEVRFTDEMTLVALNPIKGFRNDENCTAFRNFLVEMDDGTSEEQLAYIKRLGMPYSAVVFSGNKSLHFLISLSEDLPNEKIWRMLAEWVLNIVTLADSKTKNPSRSIRIPGAWREPTKQQTLVEIRSSLTKNELVAWLAKHPNAKPQTYTRKEPTGNRSIDKIKPWVIEKLKNGVDRSKGRNQQWYAIACEFYLAGYSLDATMELLSEYFVPERDFKEREWKVTVASAFKRGKNK